MTSWITSPTEISQRRSITVSGVFGIMAVVLIAVGSLLSIYDAGRPPSPPNAISLASADVQRSKAVQRRYTTKPIRDIQPIADRVLADNPETPGQAPSDFGEFERESWRIVRMEVPKPDAEWMRVTLARPVAWVEAAGRDDHGRLWLEFKELGIANWANVLAIEPCPESAVGEGRLVTGKFEHSSAEVIGLFVDGVSEPIGTTSNHPFWSEDRHDFVQAGRLRIGERLRLRDGSTPVLNAAVPRSPSVPVFNLEVDGEHVYYVAASGVLVHNTCDEFDPKDGDPWTQDANGRWHDHEGRYAGKWPNDGGFYEDPTETTLEPGTVISRYGRPEGYYGSPNGVDFGDRGLPGVGADYPERFYRVIQPIDGVLEGPASPAFGQPGGGTQWLFPETLQELEDLGYIERIEGF